MLYTNILITKKWLTLLTLIFSLSVNTKTVSYEFTEVKTTKASDSSAYKTKQIKLALELYKKNDYNAAIRLCKETTNLTGENYILSEKILGTCYEKTKNYNQAIIHYKNVLSKLNKNEKSKTLNSIGFNYAQIYNYEKALEFLFEAYKINEITKDLMLQEHHLVYP